MFCNHFCVVFDTSQGDIDLYGLHQILYYCVVFDTSQGPRNPLCYRNNLYYRVVFDTSQGSNYKLRCTVDSQYPIDKAYATFHRVFSFRKAGKTACVKLYL